MGPVSRPRFELSQRVTEKGVDGRVQGATYVGNICPSLGGGQNGGLERVRRRQRGQERPQAVGEGCVLPHQRFHQTVRVTLLLARVFVGTRVRFVQDQSQVIAVIQVPAV